MHNGYLQVEGRKMSKSEGNFVTISDLLHTEKVGGRKWPGEVVRLALADDALSGADRLSAKRLEEPPTPYLNGFMRTALRTAESRIRCS